MRPSLSEALRRDPLRAATPLSPFLPAQNLFLSFFELASNEIEECKRAMSSVKGFFLLHFATSWYDYRLPLRSMVQ